MILSVVAEFLLFIKLLIQIIYLYVLLQQQQQALYGPSGATAVAAQSNVYTGNIPAVSGEVRTYRKIYYLSQPPSNRLETKLVHLLSTKSYFSLQMIN